MRNTKAYGFQTENLTQSTDYYPLRLLFHVGTNDRARSSLRSIRKDYRALGVVVRDSGAEVVFFPSILPVKRKGFEKAR